MFPLALAPYIPAAAAGIGAFAKGAQRYGPQIVQGGINTLNRLGQSPFVSNLANRFNFGFAPQGGKIGNTFSQLSFPGGMQTANPANIYGLENISDIADEIKNQEFLREVDEDLTDGKVFDKVDKLTKEIKEIFNEEEETKKNKEPSIDDLPLDAQEIKDKKKKEKDKKTKKIAENLKKGGYVKKQRKRKSYKSSGFVRMKKSKKRKYI